MGHPPTIFRRTVGLNVPLFVISERGNYNFNYPQINNGSLIFSGNGEAASCIESPSVAKTTDAGGSFVRSGLGSILFRAAEPPPTKTGATTKTYNGRVCFEQILFERAP